MSVDPVVIALDIGGTKLAGGVLTTEPRLLHRLERPTRAAEGVDVSLGEVYRLLQELCAAARGRGTLTGVGVCAPGPLDPATGVVFNPTNMPGWVNVPLAEEIQRLAGVPCRVENDANGAGLGEALYGAGRGHSSVFYATLSTGIGAGLILDGRVYHGQHGAAAEGGHVSIDYQSPVICNCGSPGCIEALASGTALARRARQTFGRPTTPEDLARTAASGDVLATRLIDETGEMLGAWLGSVISLLDPSIVVLGGGVSRIGEPLFAKIRETVPKRTVNPFAAEIAIVPAQLGPDVGIFGAGAVILTAAQS